MEVKKSPKADLEKKTLTHLLIGLVVVLSFMFVALELSRRDVVVDTSYAVNDEIFEEEIIPITERPEEQPPPPKETPKVVDVIEIVDNKVEVEAPAEVFNEDHLKNVDAKYIPPKEPEPEVQEDEIYQVAEQMPEFPGGNKALLAYLSRVEYPQISLENGVQGSVFVEFVINKDGSVVDAVVKKGVDPYLDKEALRKVKAMPKWKPGMQGNKPVRVRYVARVTFRISS